MAKLAPLSLAELDHELAGVRLSQRSDLRDLHVLLMRATPIADAPPLELLTRVAGSVAAVPRDLTDGLQPRSRTVFRLIRAGALDAAWRVLIDNATGVVQEPFGAATSAGAPRRSWRLPLLTRIEPPTVYADLPGFRDPRFAAPDDCYDITASTRLRCALDDIAVGAPAVTFGGWAAIDGLETTPDELVRLVASNGDLEVVTDGRRLRRADLVNDRAEPVELRAWAGWSARLDLADPRLVDGSWVLSVELSRDGIMRRGSIGDIASDLARAGTTETRAGDRLLRWETDDGGWRLILSAS